ncbi:hypothetical protein A5745_16840 [Mycobacterium sp. IS-2888]|uniref:hypothetical protein n=1 Tax=Mycobacterium sp. IS-2888 TaxID=1834159 RepID=UPI00096D048A|nr:hypothetical protein [Mycobacterium sp. IS-2888]OMC44102.1 hypothetical protein A5745_16840 [Mycobacterium sp. IS-2888]
MKIKEYGLRLPDGHISIYRTRESAIGARGRFNKIPATAHSVLLVREVEIGDWHKVALDEED